MIYWLRHLRFRILGLFRKRKLEAEMAEEIQLHIERQADLNLASGMSIEDARFAASRQFGSIDSIKENARDEQRARWIEILAQDLQFGVRQLLKTPGYTLVTVLTLALGIGAAVAIFTAADDLLFRPLPYREAGRLVRIWENNMQRAGTGQSLVSADNFLDWKDRSTVFEDMAAYYDGRSVLSLGDQSEELHIQGVTTNFFALLGVDALHGQLFNPANETDAAPGLIISSRLWQSRFGADAAVIGRTVKLDSISGVVIGVAPLGFSVGSREVDIWLPLELRRSFPRNQGRDLNAIARLKSNTDLSQAAAQMRTLASALEREDPAFNKDWGIAIEPLRDSFTRNVRTSLLVLLGGVGLLLITACGNAANLLVARHLSRRTELAVRSALGASQWRLLHQLFTESMLLAALSGAAGLMMAKLALAGLVELAPRALTQIAEIFIDLRVVLVTLGLSTLTGILFGLAPALVSARSNAPAALKQGCRSASSPGRKLRLWMIAGQLAVSVILLSGGLLLLRSFVKLQAIDPGLQANNVLTFHLRVPSPKNVGLFAQSIERISALPGVRSASATSFLPFDGLPATTHVRLGGQPAKVAGDEPVAAVRTIMPQYFATMGIPLLRGRDFTKADNLADAPMRFVVNETFVRQNLLGEDPLGRTISTSMARTAPFGEIIGVVGDVREGSLRQLAVPTVYYVYAHMTYGQMNLVIRTERDPLGILSAVRSIIHDLDAAVPVADARTMEAILGETYARERFSAILMGCFSIVALLLAAIGVYGILSYSVSTRSREIGIRLAVGAPAWRIVAMVLADALRFVVPGLLAGVVGAWGITRLLGTLLYVTRATEPAPLIGAPAILLLVALIAAFIPARRAASLDPLDTLRGE